MNLLELLHDFCVKVVGRERDGIHWNALEPCYLADAKEIVSIVRQAEIERVRGWVAELKRKGVGNGRTFPRWRDGVKHAAEYLNQELAKLTDGRG